MDYTVDMPRAFNPMANEPRHLHLFSCIPNYYATFATCIVCLRMNRIIDLYCSRMAEGDAIAFQF